LQQAVIQVLRETKEAPPEIQARIARAGGRSFYGEPNFRIVWGRNIRAGELDGPYPLAAPDHWYIERWIPPEVSQVPRGEYAICEDQGLLGARLPETGVLENFLIPLIQRSRGIPFRERRAAIQAREEREERSFERRAYDVLDDAGPAFHGAATSGPAGPVKSFLEKTEKKWARRAKR
jgi:hypothetical protein